MDQIYQHLKLVKNTIKRKTLRKKLEEQLAVVRKQLHENYNSFKSNKELFHYRNKTPPDTLTPWAKGTTLIAGNSMLHEIDENRLPVAKTEFG